MSSYPGRIEIDTGDEVLALKFTANGEYLVSGGNNGLQAWRAKDGKRVATMQTKWIVWSKVWSIAASKDGRYIAAGLDGQVVLWDATTYEQVFAREVHSFQDIRPVPVFDVDFSPDSTRLLYTAGATCTAIIRDIAARKQVEIEMPSRVGLVFAAKYSPQGDRIATASDKSVQVWDSNNRRLLVNVEVGLERQCNLLWFDNYLFVTANDIEIIKIDASTGSTISEWSVPETPRPRPIALPYHGRFIAYATQDSITFWDASTRLGLISRSSKRRSIAFSPDSRFSFVSQERKIVVRDLCLIENPEIQVDSAALTAWKNAELTDAERFLTVAIPTSTDTVHHVLASRALVRARLQHWDAALVDAEESIKIRSSVVGHIAMCVALVGKGEIHAGCQVCDTASLQFRPNYVGILLLIKPVVLFMAGEYKDAISIVDALATTVDSRSTLYVVQAYMHVILGDLYMECGDHERAIESFEHARVKLGDHYERLPLIISLISGWNFDDLAFTIQQRFCEALLVAGRIKEAGESILRVLYREVLLSESTMTWVVYFIKRCLSAPIRDDTMVVVPKVVVPNDAPHHMTPLLRVWARFELTAGSWKDALTIASSFVLPRFTIYQVLCEHLEMTNHVADAVSCFYQMSSERAQQVGAELTNWIRNFGSLCSERLEDLGDSSMSVQRYDEAILQYTIALSLNLTPPQDILAKRGKAYAGKGEWEDALSDANEVIRLDSSSPLGYVRKYEILRGLGRLDDAINTFEVMPLKMSESSDPDVHEQSRRYNGVKEIPVTMKDTLLDLVNTISGLPRKERSRDFGSLCCDMLEDLGDSSMSVRRYNEAILQYTTALSLNPAAPQDILFKRSKAYACIWEWRDALNDANEVIELDSTSALGYVRKYESLCGLGHLEDAMNAFEVMLLKMSESSNPNVHERSRRYIRAKGMIPATIKYTLLDMISTISDLLCKERIQGVGSLCRDKLEDLGDNFMDAQRYDEAILQYTTALLLNPIAPRGLLLKRSKAHAGKGEWEDALIDADEIISLDPFSASSYERKYTLLYGIGRHDDVMNTFDTMLLKMSKSSDPEIREQSRFYVKPETMRRTIRTIIEDTIRDSPPVLIDTNLGRLCNKSEQASAFEKALTFTGLVSTMTTHIDYPQVEEEVGKYFRYATFSHKWEDNEPLFEKVVGVVVYDLGASPAHEKLQMFCQIVREAGFNWAWSDTCCINKGDHFVLQEALVSMFKWYERSAMTLVFLRGVDRLAKRGALTRNIWNMRAWTLQEYHASKVVRIYTEDWTPYLGLEIYNHKESPEIVSEMEEATGISAQALRALCPGLDNIREKLRLASTRQTTREEDAAYSLLGIFSLSLPITYGEGDKALGRLLAQLLTNSGDVTSILAWTGKSGSFNACLPSRITVFSEPSTTHIPQAVSDVDMKTITAETRSLNFTSLSKLYDKLYELPAPFFVERRLKLPCLAFKLGQVLGPQDGSEERVFRAQTNTLGVVEIKTQEDLSQLGSLCLAHPWIDVLFDRQPVGNVIAPITEEDTPMLGELPSSPGPSNTALTTRQSRAARLMSRIGLPFGGRSALGTPSLLPPSTLSPAERRSRVLQFIARLRQPFGALLLTATRRNANEYRRVAAESLIRVQVEKITPEILDRLTRSVHILDVL